MQQSRHETPTRDVAESRTNAGATGERESSAVLFRDGTVGHELVSDLLEGRALQSRARGVAHASSTIPPALRNDPGSDFEG